MKDIKLLLEKVRINRERELEKEVKIFLDLKKLNDGTPKGEEQNLVATEKKTTERNSLDSHINYVRKKMNNLRRKTVFEQSYYRNVINCYDHSEHYKEILKYTPVDFSGIQEPELKKAITDRENLLSFYYAYLVRKTCEPNFLKCVHNYFVRSLTYSSLEKNLFFNFLSANLCVLAECIKQVEVLLVENENKNLAQLLQQCRDILLDVYRELCTLQGMDKEITKVQLVVVEENHDLLNSLVKYFPFLDEHFGKSGEGTSRHDTLIKKLYGIYAFIYVFSNVFYLSSLSVSRAKVGQHLPVKGMPKEFSESNLNNHLQRFAMYQMYIEQYAKGDFMELNEKMLFLLSREMLAQKGSINYTWDDILHNLNSLKNATALQSEFFAASGVKKIDNPTKGKDEKSKDSISNCNVNHVERNPPILPCIHQFFYIGIDFDKTIIKKDSYSAFFKILQKHYFKQNVTKGNDTLTEEDIYFFDNFSLEKMKNKPEPTTQEKIQYIHKLGQWFVIKELEILEELKKDQEKKEHVYSQSYYYYMNQVDRVHVTYSMLLSYYDVFKGVDVDVLNNLISEHYERFELSDYFLEVFLHLLNYKMDNRDSFYFDIITLNLKKQICLYTIRNNLLKLKGGEGSTFSPVPPPRHTKEGRVFQNEDDYYETFKKYFHVYYSKTHTYDKAQRKYTGAFEYNRLKIKHSEYQPRKNGNDGQGEVFQGEKPHGETSPDEIERVSLCSFYDKTLIKTRVCSILHNINHKLSAFIGDSLIDLDAMLHSDIAILVGHNELLISFCEKHNIIIKPLVCAAAKIEFLARRKGGLTKSTNGSAIISNDATTDVESTINCSANKISTLTDDERTGELNDLYDEGEKIIYSTQSWLEIGIFFFGDI